jgi:hypothetical protein
MLVAAVAAGLVGCATHTEPVVDLSAQTEAERNFETVWDASLDTLREWGWEIAFTDRRAGRIVTQPMTGKQVWEFWREDAATWSGAMESSLQTIYRQATVTVRAVEDSEQFAVTAYVTETRSNRPHAQLNVPSEAAVLYFGGGASPARMLDRGRDRKDDRDALGLNAPLSQKLTGAIYRNAELAAPPEALGYRNGETAPDADGE